MVIIESAPASQVPKDAVLLTRNEALSHQWKTISNWSQKSDVWPFKHGVPFLMCVAAGSAITITIYYRKILKLRNYGKFPMFLPTVLLPTILLPVVHQKTVVEHVLLQDTCPVCVTVRSMATQVGIGVLYPMILAPVGGFMYASTFLTYDVPLLERRYIRELFSIYLKITRPILFRVQVLVILNCLIGGFIADQEAKAVFRVQEKILLAENAAREASK